MANSIIQQLSQYGKLSKTETKHGKFYVLNNDFIGQWMLTKGHFEDYLIHELLQFLREGDHVLDIGGNIGCFAVPFRHKIGETGKLSVFEAQSVMSIILVENMKLNFGDNNDINSNINSNIKIYNNAVGHQCGLANMNSNSDSGYPVDYFSNRQLNFGGLNLGKGGEPVKMITLDSIMNELDHVRLIKVDVEGSEQLVIWGSKKLIARDLPIICYEQNHKTITPDMVEYFQLDHEIRDFKIESFLRELGYTQFIWHKLNVIAIHPNSSNPK